MNYNQTLEFLYEQLPAYHRIGKAAYKDNLDNTILLDNYLGNPHTKFRSIHIAGTNGKGSVSHMAASVLQEAGFRTGLYTSPHLKDFRERIRVNGQMIPKKAVSGFIGKHMDFITRLKPSFFELCVAMAFDYFAGEEVEIAVVETGLGGRLDSTNIINPLLSVITNIGHDHFDLLGDTLEKVAREKAGIIKRNTPVVIGETQPELKGVFSSKAAEMGSSVFYADENYKVIPSECEPYSSERDFTISHAGRELIVRSGLTGNYQSRNIATLMQVMERFSIFHPVNQNDVSEGIRKVVSNTGLQGRWQILKKSPLVICDTAHNEEGLRYVMEQLSSVSTSSLHMIIGFVSDKDLGKILPLFPVGAKYYFTRAKVQRALSPELLYKMATEFKLRGKVYSSVKKAYIAALKNAGKNDLIFIGGSTFVVAEVV